jgi:hypothetical protein
MQIANLSSRFQYDCALLRVTGCDPSTSLRVLLPPQSHRYQCAYGTTEQRTWKYHNRNTIHSPASSFTNYFLVKIFRESKGSFSYSQKQATRPYPKPDESSSHLHCLFPLNPSQLSSCLSGYATLPSVLAAKNSVTPCTNFPFRATCPTHLILQEFIIVIISPPAC